MQRNKDRDGVHKQKNYFCLKTNSSSPLRERKETEGKKTARSKD